MGTYDEVIKFCFECANLRKECEWCIAKSRWSHVTADTAEDDDYYDDDEAIDEDVTHQPHYTRFKIQPIEFIKANDLGFLEGNVIKYICRYPYKGTPLKDLYKAKDYIEHLIAKQKEKEGNE